MTRCRTVLSKARRRGLTAAVVAAVPLLNAVASPAAEPLAIWVSIVPQKELVARVGGERVTVEALVQPGHSPATYEPTPKQLAALREADLYVTIGVPFERSLLAKLRATMPDLRIVDGVRGIERHPMGDQASPGHHGRGEPDPHVWLDPLRVKIHAATVYRALRELAPQHGDELAANLERFQAELDAVHERIAATLAPLRGRELFVFHPAYGYFARRYGLRQVAVEIEGKEPTARQLAELIDGARKSGVRALFVQPQFSGASARALAEAIGAEVVALDPLAPDYLANLETMAARIAAAYQPLIPPRSPLRTRGDAPALPKGP